MHSDADLFFDVTLIGKSMAWGCLAIPLAMLIDAVVEWVRQR